MFSGNRSILALGLLATTWLVGGCSQPFKSRVNPVLSSQESAILSSTEEESSSSPSRASSNPSSLDELGRAAKTTKLPAGYSLAEIKQELQRLESRPCEQRPEQTIGAVLYWVCMDTDVTGRTRILAASSSLPGEQQGANYWFREEGELYAFEEILPGGRVFSVLVADQETLVKLSSLGEVEVLTDRTQWQELRDHTHNAVALIREELGVDVVRAAGSPPVGILLVAGLGGDFHHRTLTLTVPQSDTAQSIHGGALRWYDLHLASMVALTAEHYCNHQSMRGVHFNYEADGGDVFMGQFFISCSEARSIMDTYGRDEEEAWVVLDRPEVDRDSIYYRIPQFTEATAREFQRVIVRQLTPDCVETGGLRICPGDRL